MTAQEIDRRTGLNHIYDRSPQQVAEAVAVFAKKQGRSPNDPQYEDAFFLQRYIGMFPEFSGHVTGVFPVTSEGVEYDIAISVNRSFTAVESANHRASPRVNRAVARRLDELAGLDSSYQHASGRFVAVNSPTSRVIKKSSR